MMTLLFIALAFGLLTWAIENGHLPIGNPWRFIVYALMVFIFIYFLLRLLPSLGVNLDLP